MRIAYSYRAFATQFGGVSQYFTRLGSQLSQLNVDVNFIAPISQNVYLRSLPRDLVWGIKSEQFPPYSKKIINFLNAKISKIALSQLAPQIVHETYYPSPLFELYGPQKRVITVFDMIHEKFPEYFPHGDSTIADKKNAIDRADQVICISNKTRDDLLSIYSIPNEKISMIHLGFDAPLNSSISMSNEATLKKSNNLIYIGSREGYKNFRQFLTAFSRSRLCRDFKLLIIGGGKLSSEELGLMISLGLNLNQIVHVSAGPHELQRYYSDSAALIYPSIYEGFGLPPLEAMSYGCPVISSNAGSMPEVLGDAASYFDPMSTDSISDAIESVVYSPDTSRELSQRGLRQVNNYSWEKCAQQTKLLYESLI